MKQKMKRILITVFLLFGIACTGFSQKPRLLLFKKFTEGTVLMRNGAKTAALLNYDAANQQMLFKQNEKDMILIGVELIDTVYIESRKFFPVESSFFLEAVSVKNGIIYVNWRLKKQFKGKKGAYGQVLQTNVETINTSYWTNNEYKNENNEVYSTSNDNEYWLKYNKKIVKCKNEKSLLKLFPEKETMIKKYMKDNKIDFNNIQQVIVLLDYCLEITKI